MARRAMLTGADNIKRMFTQAYQPAYVYSVAYVENGAPCFQYCDADHDKGEQEFEAYIDMLDDSGNDDLLYIRFHPLEKKKGLVTAYVDKKTPTILVIPVRVHTVGEGSIVNGVGEANGGTWKMYEAVNAIKALPDRQAAFEERVLALLEEPEDATVIAGPVDQTEKYVNMVVGALKEPNVIANIHAVIRMFNPNYNPPVVQRPQPAISGVNDTQMPEQIQQQAPPQQDVDVDALNVVLNRLNAHCNLVDDLGRLATLAEQNPAMFKMVLTQLRSL
jgi:hypothetical protein